MIHSKRARYATDADRALLKNRSAARNRVDEETVKTLIIWIIGYIAITGAFIIDLSKMASIADDRVAAAGKKIATASVLKVAM